QQHLFGRHHHQCRHAGDLRRQQPREQFGRPQLRGGTLRFLSALSSNRGVTLNTGGGTFYDAVGATLSGTISGIGGLTKVGDAGRTLSGFNNYTGGTTTTAGGIAVTNDSAVGSGTVTLNGGAFIAGANGLNITNA